MTKYSKYLFVTHLLSLMSFLSCISNKKNIEKLKPNIVFIMADDLGFMDLPIYGNKFNESPNISKLASQGLIFSNAYAAPVCSPTRASIQSGQYPARVGIFDFIPGHWRPFEQVIVPHTSTKVYQLKFLPLERPCKDRAIKQVILENGIWVLMTKIIQKIMVMINLMCIQEEVFIIQNLLLNSIL